MNVFFWNRDTSYGVEYTGQIFIEILKRTKGIDNIDIYASQCGMEIKSVDFSPYDLILLNDFDDGHYFETLNRINLPVINLAAGGITHGDPECVTSVLDFNLSFTTHHAQLLKKRKRMEFVSSNIWENITPWEDRSDDILYIGRLNERKILPNFISFIRKQNKKIKFYGPMVDESYYEKHKDVIDYQGMVSRKDLLQVYNEHKFLWLFSLDECLSMTIREGLACGCIPIVLNNNHYVSCLSGLLHEILPFDNSFDTIEDIIKDINFKMLLHPLTKEYIKQFLSFDRMILTFFSEIEMIMDCNLEFCCTHETPTNHIGSDSRSEKYLYSTSINWEKINV